MAKLSLELVSTDVLGVHSIVNIILNDVLLEENLQLSANSQQYEFDFVSLAENTLTLSLLNAQATDLDGDGEFLNVGESMQAKISHMEILDDTGSQKTLVPQQSTTFIVPEGYAESGREIVLVPEVLDFVSLGDDYSIKFNNEKILALSGSTIEYYKIVDDKLYTLDDILVAEATPL